MSGKARSAPTERPDDASAHLQPRKQAGFVTTRRAGVRVHHRIADDVAPPHAAAESRRGPPSRPVRHPCRLPRRGPRGRTQPCGTAVENRRRGAVVLGMRPVDGYRASHIPGALHIPVTVRQPTDRGRQAIRTADGKPQWRPSELPVGASTLTVSVADSA
ncbi:hypothetical protein NKH77_50745 [Streptomyces sp. M19]